MLRTSSRLALSLASKTIASGNALSKVSNHVPMNRFNMIQVRPYILYYSKLEGVYDGDDDDDDEEEDEENMEKIDDAEEAEELEYMAANPEPYSDKRGRISRQLKYRYVNNDRRARQANNKLKAIVQYINVQKEHGFRIV